MKSPFSCSNLLWPSIHHEYDFPWEIGAIPSEMGLTAPMPWGGIVLVMNTRRDYTLNLELTLNVKPDGSSTPAYPLKLRLNAKPDTLNQALTPNPTA